MSYPPSDRPPEEWPEGGDVPGPPPEQPHETPLRPRESPSQPHETPFPTQRPSYESPFYPPYAGPPSGHPQPYAPHDRPGPSNGFALASLVTAAAGVVSCVLMLPAAIVAVVLGHVALSQIRRTGQTNRWMAITGICVGYAALAFWAAFIALGVSGAFDDPPGSYEVSPSPAEPSWSPSVEDSPTDETPIDDETTGPEETPTDEEPPTDEPTPTEEPTYPDESPTF